MTPTYSKDLPEIPEEIAKKAYDVYMFFRRNGHNIWAYHHLCSRDFVDAEVAQRTKQYKEAMLKAETRAGEHLYKLQRIWKELDPMFNKNDNW
jgi:hypothetical protein